MYYMICTFIDDDVMTYAVTKLIFVGANERLRSSREPNNFPNVYCNIPHVSNKNCTDCVALSHR